MNEKFTPLYEPVSEDKIKEILRVAFGKDVLLERYHPATGGFFNTSYWIETSTPYLKTILRIAPSNLGLLVGFERTMMSAEPVIYDLMRGAGLPVPAVLYTDTSHRVIPRDFIFLEFIDAVPMSRDIVPEEVKPLLRQELGIYTRQLHSVYGDRFGWINRDGSIRGSKNWDEFIGGFIQELCQLNFNHKILQKTEMETIEYQWGLHSQFFNDGIIPTLVHNDLWEPNILVGQEEDGWHIKAIIDGDRAMFADREYEFVLWGNNAELMQGYGIPLDTSPIGSLRRNWYQLNLALMNAYVYQVEFLDEENCQRSMQWATHMLSEIQQQF
jgi:aminoglycoside phosphotransferase (APT) family kinase protein